MINDRPTYLRVNLDAVLNNYRKLDKLNGLKTSLAVVKADSYGLGAKVIADYLYKNGVRDFATATLEEALELKDVVKESMVKEWFEETLKELEKVDGKLKFHIKLETGMNRIGTSEEKELMDIYNLFYSGKTEFEGIFSHYSNADGEDNEYDDYQTANFNRLVELFKLKPKYIHIENSAGIIKYSDKNDICNLSRIGIALYGCYPSSNIERLNKLSLEPVVSLVSKVTHVKKILKGTKVGYGISYEALEDEYIATIPIGYADGLLRRAQGFKLNVAGEECEIVGRVCMDQLMVRCSKNTKVGDDVVFFGEYNNQQISVDDFAAYQNTISYEVFCCINKRVPRKYYINKMEL